MSNIIKAKDVVRKYYPEMMLWECKDASEKIKLKNRIIELIDLRQKEATRLYRDIYKSEELNAIDFYNKGMLYKLESEIEDLKSLLSE